MAPSSVLITGANRGIGLEFVRQLSQLQPVCPTHVFAGCRSPASAEDLKELQANCTNVTIVKIDLNDEATFAAAVQVVQEKLGDAGLNLLINNAAIASRSSLETVTSEEMVDIFKVNAVGPLMLTKAFLPLLRKAATGSGSEGTMSCDRSAVFNISSGVASITENDTGGGYAYRTSKAALNMITKNMSLDLKKDGILVSAVHPGWIKSGMGGPNAPTESSDCVKALLKLIDSLKGDDGSGKFYNYSGREMPW